MNEALHQRARGIREQALIRSWEYRQRNHTKGVWYRFRRVLVDAAQAWIIEDRDADRLEREGRIPLPVGRELAPPKRLFLLTMEDLKSMSAPRQVPVRLCSELLLARNLALIAHAGTAPEVT